jgi:pyruvate dehydrogenase E2 component (dihydrolipoamide acetyltransferase)
MEIPSPFAGTLGTLNVSVGDKVSQGQVFADIDTGDAAPVDDTPTEEPVESTETAEPTTPIESTNSAEPAKAQDDTDTVVREVKVPELGGASGVEVIEILVAPGDHIAEGDPLLVLESDKASLEVPSPCAGEVIGVNVELGAKVSEGDAILSVSQTGQSGDAPGQTAAAAEPASTAPERKPTPTPTPTPKSNSTPAAAATSSGANAGSTNSAKVHAGPAVRKMGRELGVDLASVTGTGPYGRILKEDVQQHVKDRLAGGAQSGQLALPQMEQVDFASFGPVRIEPMSSIHKLTAANMHRSWLHIPRVSQFDEVDITDLEKFRASMKTELDQAVKLTPMPFLLKACAAALRKNPQFNASLHADGEHLVYKDYVHIGFAVDTPAGLMVPVIRDVDRKSVMELAQESAELAALAKARKLSLAQMQGGCFTISSLGNIGGTGFTPIINAPELAILGVSRLAVKPVWNGKKFKPRKMLPLTLAYDHRAINGSAAGRFMHDLASMLADVRRLLL